MEFNVLAFLFAMGCCLISLVVAGKSGSKEDKEWFANLNHPDNSFLLKIMNIIGVIFYMLFGFILYHLFVSNHIVSIVLVVIIIQLMGLSPLLKYKTRNLKLFFFVMLVFPILLSVLIFFLLQANLILAMLVIVYSLWLVYDLSYFFRLMKLNK
jgi:tryptophan-rich sensory protein